MSLTSYRAAPPRVTYSQSTDTMETNGPTDDPT
jgi:hypothetical protein